MAITEILTKSKQGTLYGVGVGPGDPELLTVKAIRLLQSCRCIYLPTSRLSTQSYVEEVVHLHAAPDCEICSVTFSLGADSEQRQKHWKQTATDIAVRLRRGEDVIFVTLGDALLYSTYIYLVRALRQQLPGASIETVPGISSFSLAAALTNTPLGEGLVPLQVIPSANDLQIIATAVTSGGCVVLMKIGTRLPEIIDLLDQLEAVPRSVFVARAGLPDQRIETDLCRLRGEDKKVGNLAIIIIQGLT